MITYLEGLTKIVISFRYGTGFIILSDVKHKVRTTTAVLKIFERKDSAEPLETFTATAYCGPKDIFKKDTGRKEALTKLLDNFAFEDRPLRSMIWKKYFEKQGKS